MMARDLLLEIGTEEIPAKFMRGALAQLEEIAKNKLTAARIAFSSLRAVGTPRRMAVIVKNVEEIQSDSSSENKGPSLKIAFDEQGQPTKAAQGFARGQGVDVAALIRRDGYVYAVKQEKGQPIITLLPQLFIDIINSLNFPKNMRWADLDMKFVRPIRWLVGMYGSEVVPFTIAEVAAGNQTRGHRFLSKGEVTIPCAEDYFSVLEGQHVMVDQDVRRRVIKEQVEKLALQQGGAAAIDEDLLEEVVYLVEYPTALCGSFEEKYLALPKEAVITPMREHQRYFPVFDNKGNLLPVFITVRNGGSDYIDTVKHGNEKVLRARLADAEFFFREDKKAKLADRVEKLKTIVFQDGLGTLYDKTLRIEKLSAFIAQLINTKEDISLIERGAKLCKTDLLTNMVCEFTELQGIMGQEYALLDGENPAVAKAIYEHYLPRFAGDELPQTFAGRIISIADKVDNIVSTFSRGLIPTGSQDPYALRRQALGVVNIMIDAKWDVSLKEVALQAMDLLNIVPERREQLLRNVEEFFDLRIKNVLSDAQIRYDMIDAVMAAGTDHIYDTWLKAQAMELEGKTTAMQKAVQAFTRAGNLAKGPVNTAIDPQYFETDAEKKLYAAYCAAQQKIEKAISAKDYRQTLKIMAQLTQPIDDFFAAVMVMVDNEQVKNNRLALLKAITNLTSHIADLNKVIVM